jgi:adenylosuccinate synthase
MPVTAVVGAQWGDEGKGKIVDYLAQDAHLVCRFGGGSNAGHTIVNEWGTFKLHSLPSGAFNPTTLNIVGAGTVVDFESLSDELAHIGHSSAPLPKFLVSDRAHVIMPYHKVLDRLKDQSLGKHKIGTTGQGIGPAYVDKVDRAGIQAGELEDIEAVREKLALLLPQKDAAARIYDPELSAFDLNEVMQLVTAWRDCFGAHIGDTIPVLKSALDQDQRILLEGQLGVMRDLDWGTYPFVTSSTTFAAGAASGAGIPPRFITDVVAVVKAYTSAVGTGPVPTELFEVEGDVLREKGIEYGATTGRPRRVGWLDGVALRHAAAVGGFTRIAVTKLDVLDGTDPIKIAVAYKLHGSFVNDLPHPSKLHAVEPVYEEVPGWQESTAEASSWNELPRNAQDYLLRISELAGAPVAMIGVGQSRSQTINLPSSREPALIS